MRAFASQAYELLKFDKASHSALELAHKRIGIRVTNTSAMTLSFFAAMGLVLWVGGNKVIAGEITVGTLTSFLTFMTILQIPVRRLSRTSQIDTLFFWRSHSPRAERQSNFSAIKQLLRRVKILEWE